MHVEQARELALAMPGASEAPHFDKVAFRCGPKKPGGKPGRIFMTLWVEDYRAVLMLDTEQQADLLARDPEVFFPVPNKWGENGATFVELAKAGTSTFEQAMTLAYERAKR